MTKPVSLVVAAILGLVASQAAAKPVVTEIEARKALKALLEVQRKPKVEKPIARPDSDSAIAEAEEIAAARNAPMARALFAGRHFRIAYRIARGDILGGVLEWPPGGWWTYHADTNELRLFAGRDLLAGDAEADGISVVGWTFSGLEREFGTPYLYHSLSSDDVGLVTPTSMFTMVVGQRMRKKRAQVLAYRSDEARLKLDPKAAQQTLDHLVVVIEGSTSRYDGKHTVYCRTDANVDVWVRHECSLVGHVDRLSFQRSDTGEILKSWANPLD